MLERSSYPDDFPQQFKLAYIPHNQELVVEYELPGYDVVPAMRSFTYVQRSDSVTQSKRPDKERRELYKTVVSQVAIRTLHEIYEADTPRHVESIVFNGYVDTVNAATGKPEQPYLVTVRAYRDRFLETHARVSLDLLRTRAREAAFLKTCLETRMPFVVDNTNPTIEDRAPPHRPRPATRRAR